MLFAVVQIQAIGDGIDALNRCYLPLAEEIAVAEATMQQLEREHERISREGPFSKNPTNALVHLNSLEQGLGKLSTLSRLFRKSPSLSQESSSLIELEKNLDENQALIVLYRKTLEGGKDRNEDKELSELNRHKTELKLGIGRLAAMVTSRVQDVGELTAKAKERTYIFGGILALLAMMLSLALVGAALRTLEPMRKLTGQVQNLAQGDYTKKVEELSERAGEEVLVLAREINAMANAVSERDHRLSERAKALDLLSLRLQQVLDTIRTGLIVIQKGRVEMINPSARREWSLKPEDKVPEDLLSFGLGVHLEVEINERLFDIDHRQFGENGSLLAIEEVTNRVKERERFARSRRLAMVGNMLAQVTHEVRNPLNAMSLNVEMLGDEQLGKDSREMLEIISREIHRLERITERYLALSRRRKLELVKVDPLSVIEDLLRTEGNALEKSGCRFELEGSCGEIMLDGDGLRRAMRNLLRNATEAEANLVKIELKPKENDVVITVTDNGKGMSEKEIEQVFNPFYTTKAKGTGLGLVISRQELEESGGTLNCESKKGEGCRFVLTIPRNNDKFSVIENLS